MQTKTLGQLADYIGAELVGDPDIVIKSAATLSAACEGDISFLNNRKYIGQLQTTRASAIVVDRKMDTSAALLIADEPYYAFCQIVVLLHGHRRHKDTGISNRADIAETATLGSDCQISNSVTICDNVKIGDRCIFYPGVYVGEESQIGDDCVLYPNVVVYDKCRIGNRVIIQANATIGEDGFGFATHKGEHHKIPHIGSVIIEDDAEIGSCCGIERGTLDDTVIGKGSKIGDLVAIGHGARIGAGSLLVAQVGIAGSAKLGHHCVVGGQAGIVGHINVGNMVQIAAQAGVINDVPDNKMILGAPATDAANAKRAYSLIEYLPKMRKSIRELEKRLDELQKPEKP